MKKWSIKISPVTIGKKVLRTMRLPPNLNARMHHMQMHRWKAAFRAQAKRRAEMAGVPRLGEATVEVVNRTVRPKDVDNLYGSAKPLVDGLVDAGVLPDDAAKFLDLRCRNERVARVAEEEVEIIIYAKKK